jgi:hypothetical protein
MVTDLPDMLIFETFDEHSVGEKYVYTVEVGYNVLRGTEYFVSL